MSQGNGGCLLHTKPFIKTVSYRDNLRSLNLHPEPMNLESSTMNLKLMIRVILIMVLKKKSLLISMSDGIIIIKVSLTKTPVLDISDERNMLIYMLLICWLTAWFFQTLYGVMLHCEVHPVFLENLLLPRILRGQNYFGTVLCGFYYLLPQCIGYLHAHTSIYIMYLCILQ